MKSNIIDNECKAPKHPSRARKFQRALLSLDLLKSIDASTEVTDFSVLDAEINTPRVATRLHAGYPGKIISFAPDSLAVKN